MFGCVIALLCICSVQAQEGYVHKRSQQYVWPTDQQVLNKLDKWQDLKFGVIFHWGLYAVPGIVESWQLCSEDEDWIGRRKDMSYEDFKKWYWGMKDSLNPTRFDPEAWADQMKDAGMQYMIFTTKHHDGFCMFDTKETDFSIMHGPFKDNPKANITKHVLDAFRNKGFMVGTYFSKPDWHSPYYWWPYFATPNRNVNYNIKRYPERWEKFQQFTFNQIKELMSDYGQVDILWLDGGQVSPRNNQDIHMDRIAAMGREKQPGLIVVDRTIHGEYENYQTPEGLVPAEQLPFPWETCMALADWGWTWKDNYKSPKRVIATLIEVVAKGGNLLLGVGPTPEGTIGEKTTHHLKVIGAWMKKNGGAIYNTRPTKVYNSGNVWFTANKDGKTMYAFYALSDKEETAPATIEWEGNIPAKGAKMTLLQNGKTVKYACKGNQVRVTLPKGIDRSESLAFSYKTK